MTVKQISEYRCDLCGTKKSVGDGEFLVGMIEISFEGMYVDREFHDRHVCDSCAKQIAAKAGNAAK